MAPNFALTRLFGKLVHPGGLGVLNHQVDMVTPARQCYTDVTLEWHFMIITSLVIILKMSF